MRRYSVTKKLFFVNFCVILRSNTDFSAGCASEELHAHIRVSDLPSVLENSFFLDKTWFYTA